MKGIDVFKRRMGSIKQVVENTPKLAREVFTEWAELDWKPYAEAIAPEDTGEFKGLLGYEVSDRQIRLGSSANHALDVEEGNSTHVAQPTTIPAIQATRHKISERTRAIIKKELK